MFYKTIKRKSSTILCLATLIFIIFSGLPAMLLETSYDSFSYPPSWGLAEKIENFLSNKAPLDWEVANNYNFQFKHSCAKKCDGPEELRLVILVKSAMDHFKHRDIIRKTWGFEKRFSDVPIRTVFLLGVSSSELLQDMINVEQALHSDIVQANFEDTYYNNTYKTMSGFTWAKTFCNNARFYVFSDDDMYVSIKNILRYLHYPRNYPGYLEKPIVSHGDKNKAKSEKGELIDFTFQPNVELWTGYLFPSSRPKRFILSKWYISLEEYPYDRYPPYISAGLYIVSRKTLLKIHYASLYVNHFKFDDIYLGIIAKKMGIELFHNNEICFYKKSYDAKDYRYVIASHGYDDPDELFKIWNEQKSIGNA